MFRKMTLTRKIQPLDILTPIRKNNQKKIISQIYQEKNQILFSKSNFYLRITYSLKITSTQADSSQSEDEIRLLELHRNCRKLSKLLYKV